MAKSFKEIGKKAEALIEQGKETDQKVHRRWKSGRRCGTSKSAIKHG